MEAIGINKIRDAGNAHQSRSIADGKKGVKFQICWEDNTGGWK